MRLFFLSIVISETGARSADVAIIVDLTGLGRRVGDDVVFRLGSLAEPRGGGVALGIEDLPRGAFQLTGPGGRGLTWYRNTSVRQQVQRVLNQLFDRGRVINDERNRAERSKAVRAHRDRIYDC